MTQQQLADAAGIRQATLSNIERGKTGLQASTLRALAAALHTSTDALMSGASDPARHTAPAPSPNVAPADRLFDHQRHIELAAALDEVIGKLLYVVGALRGAIATAGADQPGTPSSYRTGGGRSDLPAQRGEGGRR